MAGTGRPARPVNARRCIHQKRQNGAKTARILLVLDNVPFAFVAPENRFFGSYGQSAAPDDPLEFAAFVGDFAAHLVTRYGLATVESFRFRLGTECDGPRFGPPWLNYTAPNPPFVAPDGRGGKFTTRDNGLEKYVQTYIAVDKALLQSACLQGSPLQKGWQGQL